MVQRSPARRTGRLFVDDAVVVPLTVAATRKERRIGLLGQSSVAGGALLLVPCRAVHTFAMQFSIDVAFLRGSVDDGFEVLQTAQMPPNRPGLPRLRATAVLEADSGSFASWGLHRGSALRIERADVS